MNEKPGHLLIESNASATSSNCRPLKVIHPSHTDSSYTVHDSLNGLKESKTVNSYSRFNGNGAHNHNHQQLHHTQQRPAVSTISSSHSPVAGQLHQSINGSSNSTNASPSSSSTSSSASPPTLSTPNSTSNGYSELLRYRSQEFYTKVHYPNSSSGSPGTTNGNAESQHPSSEPYSSHVSGAYTNGTLPSPSSALYQRTKGHAQAHLTSKELSLNDLSHPSLYASIDSASSSAAGSQFSSAAQLLQSRLTAQRYYPHHPHYNNHLYSAGALPGALSGSASLVRSNSSLSLSYHQYQKKYSRLLNANQQLVPNHPILSQVSQNPSVTLSTHNLFSDSGYCSAYSGSIASGTLDSRHSKISTESSTSYYQHPVNVVNLEQHVPASCPAKSVDSSPSSSTSNYYSSSPSLSATTSTASTSSPPSKAPHNLMVSTASPSHSGTATAATAQTARPYGATSSSGRATLTRSSSSGPGVADSTLSVAPGNQYGQLPGSYFGAASRPASLVTVLADGSAQQQSAAQHTFASPTHQYGPQSQQYAGSAQSNYHLYGSSTAKNVSSPPSSSPYHKTNGISAASNSNYSLPQRFPTTITQTKSPSVVKLVSTAAPPTIMSSSYHSHYSATTNQGKVMLGTGHAPSSSQPSQPPVPPTSASCSTNAASGNQSSFPRSLFSNSTNIFESKKNKLFGSVSSIDLQCLKESQKVSVIERKSSRIGRSLKNSSSTSTAVAPSTQTTTNGGNGGTTTSSFFRLFTSSSSKKMIPFAFSGSSSSNQQTAQSALSPQSPPTPGSAVPSAFSGSSSSASSSSSTHTITARSDLVNGDPKRAGQTADQTKPIKSNSLDSAANTSSVASTINSLSLSTANMSTSASSTTSQVAAESTIPSNEVLFRRYFTFFDLMSALNHQRLFETSPTSGGTINSANSSTSSMSTSSHSVASNVIQESAGSTTIYQQQRINGSSAGAVTTFESSTLSSTSSYSSCTSSLSSASHPTQSYSQYSYKSTLNTAVTASTSNGKHAASNAVASSSDVGNDLLAPSPNFLNEIGSERQYSIELRWNNGSKEEIPAEMLDEKKHNADQSIYDTVTLNGPHSKSASSATCPPQLHPPLLARCLNIFSDASPFTNPGHSVMSDLYGSGSLTIGSGSCASKSSAAADFGSDDGFVSLSSASHGSTYPNGSHGTVGSITSGEVSRCPFSAAAEKCNVVEVDYGTNFYRTHFRDSEHQNWLQIHEKYGPIVVSLRKERVKSSSGNCTSAGSSASCTRWRVIVRTTSLIPLRGTIAALPSICLPGGNPGSCSLDSSAATSKSKGSSQTDQFNINSVRDVLSLLMPKSVCVSNFRLGSPTAVSFLLKLDELSQNTEYKIGVLYAFGAQHSEEEFYNNILDYSTSSKNQFYDFLGLISSRVRLKDYKGYKAGLDVLNDTTGEYSWTARHHSVDIMFHVCTELPFTETNRQQLPRKRHIGNDIVTIVFLHEEFNGPAFTPSLIRSKFQQVFIIVKPVNNGQYYRVAVARHRLVPLFGPPLKPFYTRHELKEFILTKIINAENACHSVNKFAEMAKRTRNEYLVDLCNKHTTHQTVHHVDSSSSSMNSLHSFKKLFGSSSNSTTSSGAGGDGHTSKRSKHLSATHEFHLVNQDAYLTGGALAPLPGPPFSRSHILHGIKDPPTLLGGIVFNERCAGSSVPSRLYVHDFSTSRDIEASLLLSNEAILVIDAASSEVIWAAPVTSIIGWTDSSGVFATSPTTSPVGNDNNNQQSNGSSGSGHRSGPLRAKSVDCEPSMVNSSSSCRVFRLYYHLGECIEIKQRPTGAPALPSIPEPSPSTTSKSGRNQVISTTSRNDDPFLHLIRILELITRKSELREIVIKRKTSPVHKPQTFTQSENNSNAAFDLLGRCGDQFGFSMSLSSGVIEDIMDQALSAYHLSPGCKVVEIAKISFAAMAPEELQELLNASVIICLTFTEFDFARYQPRCSCPSPQALQMQRQKNQMTPPSEYENLPLAPKILSAFATAQSSAHSPAKSHLSNGGAANGQPGVKTIHITHNPNASMISLPQSAPGEQSQSQSGQPQHQALMNVSSTSSNSSYYSTNNSHSQNQSPSQHYGTYQSGSSLYQAKSASNLSQYNYGSHKGSPTKSATTTALSAANSPANTGSVVRSRSSTINNGNGSASFKDNLIRLITMDDCGLSPTGSSQSTHSPGNNGEGTDASEVKEHHSAGMNTTQMSLASAYHPSANYYGSTTTASNRNPLPGHVQATSTNPYYNRAYDIAEQYSSYPSSRYSTASSTQYSSLGRNAALAAAAATQIQVPPSGSVLPGSTIRPNPAANSSVIVESNDCYLLTAQPVRVDSNSSSSSATIATSGSSRQDQHHHHQNLMTASLDSTSAASLMSSSISSNTCNSTASSSVAMFNSLLSSSSATSASDTIAGIVWPSMHQLGPEGVAAAATGNTVEMTDSPPSSMMIHTPLNRAALAGNEIVVVGNEQMSKVGPVVETQLTDEVRKLSLEKDVLNDTILKLREENQRLHQESQNASQQLRKLTEWFFNTGSSGSASSSSNASTNGTPTSGNTTTISIQPSQSQPQSSAGSSNL